MKLRYWTIGFLALLYYVASCQSDPYEPREEVVECGLPDGSRFILRSKYLGAKNNWGNLLGGHGAKRIDQEGFEAFYEEPHYKTILARKNAASYGGFKDDVSGQSLCSGLGKKNGVPYVDGFPTYFLPKDAKQFSEISIEDKLLPSGSIKEAKNLKEKTLREKIEEEKLTYGSLAATHRDHRSVWEIALMKEEGACKNTLAGPIRKFVGEAYHER